MRARESLRSGVVRQHLGECPDHEPSHGVCVSVGALAVSSGCASMHDTFGHADVRSSARFIGGALGAVGRRRRLELAPRQRRSRRSARGGYAIGGGVGRSRWGDSCARSMAEEADRTRRRCARAARRARALLRSTVDCRCVATTEMRRDQELRVGLRRRRRSPPSQNAKHTYTSAGNYNATCTRDGQLRRRGHRQRGRSRSRRRPPRRRSCCAASTSTSTRRTSSPRPRACSTPRVEAAEGEPGRARRRSPATPTARAADAYNQGLSERRANAVRDYLAAHGIDGFAADRRRVRRGRSGRDNDDEGRPRTEPARHPRRPVAIDPQRN